MKGILFSCQSWKSWFGSPDMSHSGISQKSFCLPNSV